MLRPCAPPRVRDPIAAPAGGSFLLAERRAAPVGAFAAAHVTMTELVPTRFCADIAQHGPRRRGETGQRADDVRAADGRSCPCDTAFPLSCLPCLVGRIASIGPPSPSAPGKVSRPMDCRGGAWGIGR